MEIEVKEPLCLEEGLHQGKIVRVEYRELPYKYTDVFIKEKETEMDLKYGCPTTGSLNGKLMKLLVEFQTIKVGDKVNPEKILNGKEVTFMTLNKEATKGGKYIGIVDNSVKPTIKAEIIEG